MFPALATIGCALLVASLDALGRSTTAINGPPVAAPVTEPPRVSLVLAGPPDACAATREVLLELLGRIDLAVELEVRERLDLEEIIARRPDDRAALAFVFVDLGTRERAVLIADGPYARILVRRLAPAEGFDEAAREEIAAIVVAAVEALRDGAQIGIARTALVPEDTTPAPTPTPVDHPSPAPTVIAEHRPRAWPLELAAAYRVQALGPGAPRHALELGVGTAGPSRVALEVAAWAGALLPSRPRGAEGVRIEGGTFRGQLGVRAALTPRITWTTSGGFGLDAFSVRVDDRPATIAAIPTAHARAGLLVGLTPRWTLGAVAHVDVDLVDTRVRARPSGRTLFDPWRAWPGAALVLAVRMPGRHATPR